MTQRRGKADYDKLVRGFELVLAGLGLGKTEHTAGTAQRAARAWWDELCAGLTHELPRMTAFSSDVHEMVILREIPVKSMCAHHLLPFFGTAAIGYIPAGKILGLSKLSRLTNHFARRPQVQEELTQQIADALMFILGIEANPLFGRGGVGVVIRANHTCMQLRGVNHTGDMVTSALRGSFLEDPVRQEFLRLAGG